MSSAMLLEAEQLVAGCAAVIIDCRFSLVDPQQGRELYRQGHIPGAHYLDLNRDLSGPVAKHGGRHPLPDPQVFSERLAGLGIGPDTDVVAYDDSRLAFAARLWWLMRSLGYRPPRLLNGGYQAFLAAGGRPQAGESEVQKGAVQAGAVQAGAVQAGAVQAGKALPGAAFSGYCDIDGLRAAQERMALVVDSREERRYQGLEEPIDLVAGHIPGAINRPWQGVTSAGGRVLDDAGLKAHWGDALEAEQLVVYCGSGVTACVNLFSLALLGRDDATLYAGSWSDWCSHL